MKKIITYQSKSQEMQEMGFFILAKNRGSKSSVVNPNPRKSILNERSRSDNGHVCQLYRLYLAIFTIKNERKSQLFEGYYFEAF